MTESIHRRPCFRVSRVPTRPPIQTRHISPEGGNGARQNIPNLTAVRVKSGNRPGGHGDGDGLFLAVSAGESKSWVGRVQKIGR